MDSSEGHNTHPQVAKKAAEVAEYVKQIQSGDRSAFQKLYDATEQYIYFCVSSQGVPVGDVADVMQEIYLAVYRNLHTIDKPQAAMGWMKRIAFHKSMDYFRSMGKDVLTETDTEKSMEVQESEMLRLPEDVMEREESGRLIQNLIHELPEEYRRVLILHYFLECSVAEIAEKTGVPEGTVKTRLYRARKELGVSIEALEKQQGIRLHSVLLMPALGFLFHKEAQAAQVPDAVHRAVAGSLAHTASAGAGNGSGVAAGLVVKKWIVVAALCVGGGVAMLLWNGDDGTDLVNLPENQTVSDGTVGQNMTPTAIAEVTMPAQPSAAAESTEEALDKTELFAAYKKLFEKIKTDHAWPDGSPLAISGDLGEALQYALHDFDGDGNEELLVATVTADYMAAYRENMYKYNPSSKECIQVSSMCPSSEYYDNGIIQEGLANGMRLGSRILSFDKESGVYEEIAGIVFMDFEEMEMIGLTFPAEEDKDGDGLVYKIQIGNKETYMDNKEWEAWLQEKIGTGKGIEIKWIPFSEGWKY